MAQSKKPRVPRGRRAKRQRKAETGSSKPFPQSKSGQSKENATTPAPSGRKRTGPRPKPGGKRNKKK